jgi:hypothetical protein
MRLQLRDAMQKSFQIGDNQIIRLRNSGSFVPQTDNYWRPQNGNVGVEEQILNVVERRPRGRVRNAARQMNVSSSIIWKTLHGNNLHLHHLQRVKHLEQGDKPIRVAFCQWLLRQHINDVALVTRLLVTDEAGFTRDGISN